MTEPRLEDHVLVTSGILRARVVIDGQPPGLIDTRLVWDELPPFALTLTVLNPPHDKNHPTNRDIVTWVFARNLLVCGGGHGAVWITRVDEQVIIALNSQHGYAELHLHHANVKDFADRMRHAMPLGEEPSLEHVDQEDWAFTLATLTSKRPSAR